MAKVYGGGLMARRRERCGWIGEVLRALRGDVAALAVAAAVVAAALVALFLLWPRL